MQLPSRPRHKNSGFTLIELIVVMIIIGILAFVVLPRFDLLKGFDEVGYRDKVKATLEYARKSAVAQRRNVRVALAGNNLTLNIETCHPEGTLISTPPCPTPIALGTYPRNLPLPVPDRACAGPTNQICAPANVTLVGTASLDFSPLGRPSAAGAYAVTGESTQNITVEAETGYVH
ncbi:MAG: type II secretion system GspH family protein [Burkholderiaceae bacterium]|nr:type II secretion system GspH family protein [Sulfuritalea sp.]MCF8174664.1 type II secretion system GspH family protein [Burkholderiaceae bacterium]